MTAEGKTAGLILACLPLGVMALIMLTQPGYLKDGLGRLRDDEPGPIRIDEKAVSDAEVADRLGDPAHLGVAGPGLEDMTRLALGSYDLWRDILATNTEHIDRALSVYIQKLEHMRENLRTRQLQSEFERAATLAGRLRRTVRFRP